MDAIILAGGLGTRLRATIGNEVPKCMASVAGKPFLEYVLAYLAHFDVNRVVLSLGHLNNVITEWVDANHQRYPRLTIDNVIEREPLGTGGAIKLAMTKCTSKDVVVLNGDTFFNINLQDFVDQHKLYPASISLALKPMYEFDRYGRVMVDAASHEVERFCEKKYTKKGLINGGIYAIDKYAIKWPNEDKFSFEKDVLESQLNAGHIYGFEYDDFFIDIGIPSDYRYANEIFPKLFA